jgi:EmrB/QacA subfamily drug resistance transporter
MATTAASAPTGLTESRRRWFGLAALSTGVTMVMIDATIINVSLPAITAELGLMPTDLQWINSIYSLVFAALLITMGRMGDAIGRRKTFLAGAALFVTASLIAATAQSGEMIIAGRAIQGIGGAMMIPASLSLLNAMFRGKDRAIAFAVWGATVGTVAAIGPLLGGYLTTTFSWRWAFFINIPIAAISLIGVTLLVRESRDEHAVRGVDVAGVLLSAIGLGALVFGLIEGQNFGWWKPRGDVALGPIEWPFTAISPVPVAFVVAFVALLTFVRIERSRAAAGRSVILDLKLFHIRSFAWGNAVGLCIMFGEFGMLLTLPLFLQNVLGYTALAAGATTAAIMVGALLAAPSSGRLTQSRGPVFVVRLGLTLEAIAMIGIAFMYQPDATQWMFVPWLLLFGVGVGLGTAQLINVVLRDVPVEQSGQASGTQSTSRQVGTALGVAVLGAVLWSSLAGLLPTQLSETASMDAATAQQVSDEIVNSSGVTINSVDVPPEALVASRYGDEAGQAAAQAFSTATAYASLVGAGFVIVGIIATFVGFRRQPGDDGTVAGPRDQQEASAGAAA